MRHRTARKRGEHFWPKIVLRKWLKVGSNRSNIIADERESGSGSGSDSGSESDDNSCSGWNGEVYDDERRQGGQKAESNVLEFSMQLVQNHCDLLEYLFLVKSMPRFHPDNYTLRRRKSETLRAQYIRTKELRICVGTWNVAGKLPPDDLDIKDWLVTEEPADIYVLGLQEIVPLNAGSIFGAEDNRPALKWDELIRETLNKIQPSKPKVKCYSDPPSPSRFKPSNDAPIETIEELLPDSDSDNDEPVYPVDDDSVFPMDNEENVKAVDELTWKLSSTSAFDSDDFSSQQIMQKQHLKKESESCHPLSSKDNQISLEEPLTPQKHLTRMLSSSERICLVWPEQPMHLSPQIVFNRAHSFKSPKSFRASSSFKSVLGDRNDMLGMEVVPVLDLDAMIQKKRSPFVKIISKQMVGIFITIWARRKLRKHIQNLKVSPVGVGVMGYIGNKGSISISMSIYQTLFCFVCTHLTSGEKDGDELRRNADVQEIHRRTLFNAVSSVGLPKTILDHERIIWLGDLNYRINLPYEKTHQLISKSDWSTLVEKDQLKWQLRKGRAFDGWSEGIIDFPPTYKYEFNSEKYVGDGPRAGRRTPAWCDRILSFGNGMKLLDYRRAEMKLSDHRPVTATYLAEVEIFCHKRLQKALNLTDAEIEDNNMLPDLDIVVDY